MSFHLIRLGLRNASDLHQVRCTLHPWDGKEESWEPAGTFRNSRSMRVGNLKPGKMYAFQVRAPGRFNRFGRLE